MAGDDLVSQREVVARAGTLRPGPAARHRGGVAAAARVIVLPTQRIDVVTAPEPIAEQCQLGVGIGVRVDAGRVGAQREQPTSSWSDRVADRRAVLERLGGQVVTSCQRSAQACVLVREGVAIAAQLFELRMHRRQRSGQGIVRARVGMRRIRRHVSTRGKP